MWANYVKAKWAYLTVFLIYVKYGLLLYIGYNKLKKFMKRIPGVGCGRSHAVLSFCHYSRSTGEMDGERVYARGNNKDAKEGVGIALFCSSLLFYKPPNIYSTAHLEFLLHFLRFK